MYLRFWARIKKTLGPASRKSAVQRLTRRKVDDTCCAVMTPPLRTAHATLRGSRPLTAAANQAPWAGVSARVAAGFSCCHKKTELGFSVQSCVLLNSITFLLWLGGFVKKKTKNTAPTSLDGKDLDRRCIMIKV